MTEESLKQARRGILIKASVITGQALKVGFGKSPIIIGPSPFGGRNSGRTNNTVVKPNVDGKVTDKEHYLTV